MCFENEEGVNRAKSMDEQIATNPDLKHLNVWLDKYNVEIKSASEPSDIIWENRFVTGWQRTKREIIVWSCLACMLLVSFALIFIFSEMSYRMVSKYPYLDCETLYGHDDPEVLY